MGVAMASLSDMRITLDPYRPDKRREEVCTRITIEVGDSKVDITQSYWLGRPSLQIVVNGRICVSPSITSNAIQVVPYSELESYKLENFVDGQK